MDLLERVEERLRQSRMEIEAVDQALMLVRVIEERQPDLAQHPAGTAAQLALTPPHPHPQREAEPRQKFSAPMQGHLPALAKADLYLHVLVDHVRDGDRHCGTL